MRDDEVLPFAAVATKLLARGVMVSPGDLLEMAADGLPHVVRAGETTTSVQAVLLFIRGQQSHGRESVGGFTHRQ